MLLVLEIEDGPAKLKNGVSKELANGLWRIILRQDVHVAEKRSQFEDFSETRKLGSIPLIVRI